MKHMALYIDNLHILFSTNAGVILDKHTLAKLLLRNGRSLDVHLVGRKEYTC